MISHVFGTTAAIAFSGHVRGLVPPASAAFADWNHLVSIQKGLVVLHFSIRCKTIGYLQINPRIILDVVFVALHGYPPREGPERHSRVAT